METRGVINTNIIIITCTSKLDFKRRHKAFALGLEVRELTNEWQQFNAVG